MAHAWTAERILELARGFQPVCILTAAAELDLFAQLARGPATAAQLARAKRANLRGMTVLLDALAALGLVQKKADRYRPAPGVVDALTAESRHSVLAMVQHQANCLRSWANLAQVVKVGQPVERQPSVRGTKGDRQSFIQAMDDLARRTATDLVAQIKDLSFTHLLDVGGASGTWTIAFLKARPGSTATLFDRPPVIPMARKRLAAAALGSRVKLVVGDFYVDPLPTGADLAWVSAIVHQNSRSQNRDLFKKVHRALVPGGRILIRDMVMDSSRTVPVSGALFAVNMLVNTPAGGTFTLAELREDLQACGFKQVKQIHKDAAGMNSMVSATRTEA